jgi:hypothetical protein
VPNSGEDVHRYDTPRTFDLVTRQVMAQCPGCKRWLKAQRRNHQYPRLARYFPQHLPREPL